jgi:hypothetical protein
VFNNSNGPWSADTSHIPRELIFVGRNINLVRSNNKVCAANDCRDLTANCRGGAAICKWLSFCISFLGLAYLAALSPISSQVLISKHNGQL